jgi:hypothetical protein
MWVTLTWKDTVDLIIVAALFYAFLLLLRRTHARFIVNAIGGFWCSTRWHAFSIST